MTPFRNLHSRIKELGLQKGIHHTKDRQYDFLDMKDPDKAGVHWRIYAKQDEGVSVFDMAKASHESGMCTEKPITSLEAFVQRFNLSEDSK